MYWGVYCKNYRDGGKISVYNIFDNSSFMDGLCRIKKSCKDFNDFSEKVDRELLYHFWSKCEYEVIISPFPSFITKEEFERLTKENPPYRYLVDIEDEIKVDVYSQVKNNYEVFIKYLWDNKDDIKEIKR